MTSFVALWVRSEGKTPKKWRTNSLFLLKDNALARRLVVFEDYLAKNNETTLEQSQHSSDLASAELCLFPRMKLSLKAQGSCDATDVV